MDAIATCISCGYGAEVTETHHIQPSSVHGLLDGNEPPVTTLRMDATLKTLPYLQPDLNDLDEDILHMRQAYQRLLAKRVALQDYFGAHKLLLSSLRRLPTELFAEIFVRTLPPFPPKSSV